LPIESGYVSQRKYRAMQNVGNIATYEALVSTFGIPPNLPVQAQMVVPLSVMPCVVPQMPQAIPLAVPLPQNESPTITDHFARHTGQEKPIVARLAPAGQNVIALMGVSVNADLKRLRVELEEEFRGRKVKTLLPIWNKGSALVELDGPVDVGVRRNIGLETHKVFAVPSEKQYVSLSTPSRFVNTRFFVMDPMRDFCGTQQQSLEYKRAESTWNQQIQPRVALEQYFELGRLLQQHSRPQWGEILVPSAPKRRTEQQWGYQRMYTQLFFKFADKEDALEAHNAIDGVVIEVGLLQVVIRTDFAAAPTVARARRYSASDILGTHRKGMEQKMMTGRTFTEDGMHGMPQLLEDGPPLTNK